MQLEVLQNLVCPQTKCGFALAISANNFKLVLCYQGPYFLQPGDTLCTAQFGLVVNGKISSLAIIHIFPHSIAFWSLLRDKLACPGNREPFSGECALFHICQLEICPWIGKSK